MDKLDISDKEVDQVYDEASFIFTKRLQQYLGVWPYDSGWIIIVKNVTVFIFFISFLPIPIISAVKIYCGEDANLCCENLCAIVYFFSLALKYSFSVVSKKKYKIVLKIVAKNYVRLKAIPEENKIIVKYVELGKSKAFAYFLYMLITAIVFTQSPLIPKYLDMINPLNESRPIVLPVKSEYFVDMQKYYWVIYGFFICISIISLILLSGIDGAYTQMMHQNLAMISIVKYRLHMATKPSTIDQNQDYKVLIDAIKLHKDCIAFSDLLEESYSTFFFMAIILTVAFTSLGLGIVLDYLGNLQLHLIHEILRTSMVCFAMIIHMFYLAWNGQLLMDATQDLLNTAYSTEWYYLSKKSKKLLHIAMMKFNKPNVITAGGITVFNFQNYATFVKTTCSYIMIAFTMRDK